MFFVAEQGESPCSDRPHPPSEPSILAHRYRRAGAGNPVSASKYSKRGGTGMV